MPDSSRDTQSPKSDVAKKPTDSVELTAEELRSIAGGGSGGDRPSVPILSDTGAGSGKRQHQPI